jgi:ribonucleoside-diphosphate reductase alpha chain
MDSLTLAISQGSLRRGSAACYLDINHPEIEEFLEIRKPSGDFNRKALNLHHGVLVTDEFMAAVRDGAEFELKSPKDGSVRGKVDARSLFQKLVETRLATGEPYIIFIDAVNKTMPKHHRDLGLKVTTSNLCSEITLPTGKDHNGVDRTGGLLPQLLEPRDLGRVEQGQDLHRGRDALPRQRPFRLHRPCTGRDGARQVLADRERSVGLGVMGFHSFLQARSIPFEGAMAKSWNMKIFKHIRARSTKPR